VFDNGMAIRKVFEDWMAKIQHHDANRGTMHPYGSAEVRQFYRTGGVMRTYRIEMIYPTEVAAIDLAWDSNDAVEEYAVTFAVNDYSYAQGNKTTTDGKGSSAELGVTLNSDGSIEVEAGATVVLP
jgi:hypothetical protein